MIVEHENQVGPAVVKPHRRLIGISLLPASATLGNLLCGFLAVFCCLLSLRAEWSEKKYPVQPRVFFTRLEAVFPTHIAAGAYLLFLAMVFDALDGRLARMTRRTSEFGAQLDSLSDVVSFGVAPAALFVTMLLRPAWNAVAEETDVSSLQFRIGLTCALVYVSCAAIRLARYNAENVKTEASQRAFSGLPSPGAGAAVAALLALHEHLRQEAFAALGVDWPLVLRWLIAGAAFSVGLLMVSRLDYMHVFNLYVRRRRPPTHLVWLIVILGLGWKWPELLLVALTQAYVISGLVFGLARRTRTREAALAVQVGGTGAHRPGPGQRA
jgi:CDP-diacylglycerol---serine O-phosphatidyltransferase